MELTRNQSKKIYRSFIDKLKSERRRRKRAKNMRDYDLLLININIGCNKRIIFSLVMSLFLFTLI
jgi:hypothetical protein